MGSTEKRAKLCAVPFLSNEPRKVINNQASVSASGQSQRLIYSVVAGWMKQRTVYNHDFPVVSLQTKSLLSRERLLLQVDNL